MTKRRTIALTEAGYRITDLMRAGVIPTTGDDRQGTNRPSRQCPVCRVPMWVTTSGLVRSHRRYGRECPGTGRAVR